MVFYKFCNGALKFTINSKYIEKQKINYPTSKYFEVMKSTSNNEMQGVPFEHHF